MVLQGFNHNSPSCSGECFGWALVFHYFWGHLWWFLWPGLGFDDSLFLSSSRNKHFKCVCGYLRRKPALDVEKSFGAWSWIRKGVKKGHGQVSVCKWDDGGFRIGSVFGEEKCLCQIHMCLCVLLSLWPAGWAGGDSCWLMGLSGLPWWHVSKLNLATAGLQGQVQAMETLGRAGLTAASPEHHCTTAAGEEMKHTKTGHPTELELFTIWRCHNEVSTKRTIKLINDERNMSFPGARPQ